MLPSADVLYACDAQWWRVHKGVPEFAGERWTTHEKGASNDKTLLVKQFPNINLAAGRSGDRFRLDGVVAYGANSGFQAVNLAILFGATKIILLGFDMHEAGGKRHFFGSHPKTLRNGGCFSTWVKNFRTASRHLPVGVTIINATPDSALTGFPIMRLCDALS
jgi:hypothetical protein